MAYVLLVEQYVHIEGRVPLSIAQKAADELLSTDWDGGEEIPDLADQAAENDAALAQLRGMLGGMSG